MPTLPILWSKLENDAGVIAPEYGPAGNVNGSPSYAAAKYNNGIDSPTAAIYAEWHDCIADTSLFSVEFWWKPHFASSSGTNRYLLYTWDADANLVDLFEVQWFSSKFRVAIYSPGPGWTPYAVYTFTPAAFSAEELVHLAFAVDTSAGPGLRIRCFQNNVELAVSVGTEGAFTGGQTGLSFGRAAATNAVFDNVKLWDYAKSDYSDKDKEGFADDPVVVTIPNIIPELGRLNIFITNKLVDIYKAKRVNNVFAIEEYKTFGRDKLYTNAFDVIVKNFDGFFSSDNPDSILKGESLPLFWAYDADGELVFNGYIADVETDITDRLAILKVADVFEKLSRSSVEYESSDWETPAEAFEGVCASLGFTGYDEAAAKLADALYKANGLYIKCHFRPEENCTFQSVVEKLAEFGCADAYTSRNKLVFEAFNALQRAAPISISAKDISTRHRCRARWAYEDIVNQYHIISSECAEGEVHTDDTGEGENLGYSSRVKFGERSLPELDGAADRQVEIKDCESAHFIGQQYIKRSHRQYMDNPLPLRVFEFSVSSKFPSPVNLGGRTKITLPEEGWNEKVFEIYRKKRIFYSHTELTVYEVP